MTEAREAVLQMPTCDASGRGGIAGGITCDGKEAAEPVDPMNQGAVVWERNQKIGRRAQDMSPAALLETREVVIGGIEVGDENAGEVRAEDGIDLVVVASANREVTVGVYGRDPQVAILTVLAPALEILLRV